MAMNAELVFSVVVLLLGVSALVVFAVAQFGARARIRRRLDVALRGRTDEQVSDRQLSLKEQLLAWLSALGRRLPLFNSSQRREMRGKLVSAGYRQSGALSVLMGTSVFFGLLVVLAAITLVWPRLGDGQALYKGLILVLGMYLGAMVPRIVVDKLVAKRQQAISDSFPDALDLMVVCANAGLGLNATILRVAQEIEFLAPELADEYSLTAAQLQVSGDTTEVLQNMADRIGLDSMRSLVSTLSQSRQYGTPVSEALRILAATERTARRMRTEEAAAKLATKITLPMMLFILPTVLLVVGGPAVIGLMGSLGAMGGN